MVSLQKKPEKGHCFGHEKTKDMSRSAVTLYTRASKSPTALTKNVTISLHEQIKILANFRRGGETKVTAVTLLAWVPTPEVEKELIQTMLELKNPNLRTGGWTITSSTTCGMNGGRDIRLTVNKDEEDCLRPREGQPIFGSEWIQFRRHLSHSTM